LEIAIIGAQTRFPGGHRSPEAFFAAVCRGENYCGDIPQNRWRWEKFFNSEDAIGKAYVRRGHFLDYDHEHFDARAFGLSPREAEFLDPQQRLLLETTWEAIENAGLDMHALEGSNTGVYIGGFTVDHLLNQLSGNSRDAIGSYSAAGATLTMLANRISYVFNLNGPSIALDTACSSSLVALVMASQDIAAGRCDAAVVGGVNFMMRPEYMIAMSKGNFLARDGRSKSFDARADGYGRGEGCGVVILEEAALARAAGHDIVALVEGCGINQDGRTHGITVPNSDAQEALMRDVAARYGIDPGSIDYVEAHGTGTPVGDPKEATAIGRVYGLARRASGRGPVVIGSVKSNIGHLEAAAGVAGVIKAAWSLRQDCIPPIAMLETPNPALPLDELHLALAVACRPLAEAGKIGRVAVNSFGYGGTNAHVVLRAAAPSLPDAPDVSAVNCCLLPVSARSEASLHALAQGIGDALEAGEAPADVIYTLSRRRSHHDERAVARAASPDGLREPLTALARGENHPMMTRGRVLPGRRGKTAFIYTGMGPQWWGMGRGLLRDNAVFRSALTAADTHFRDIAGFSILEELLRDEATSRIAQTELAQPANFLVQYGLTLALAAEGVHAEAVLGHSVGEVAAACASGMLNLEQAVAVSRHRSRIQAQVAGRGGMLAVGLGEAALTAILANIPGSIDIAAVNSPSAITVAGDSDALDRLHELLVAQGVFSQRLAVAVPYHSRFMEPLRPELLAALQGLTPTTPHCRLYSTVTGAPVGDLRYDAAYWCDNVRQPVRFMDAVARLIGDGYTHLLEVGPHPVLGRSIKEIVADLGAEIALVPTLSMKEADAETFPRAIAGHYVRGGKIDWQVRSPAGRRVALPNYPWNRERLWRETAHQVADRTGFQDNPFGHTHAADGALCTDLNVAPLNYLQQHRVDGVAVFPAAAFIEALLEAAEPDSTTPRALYHVGIDKSLVLARDAAQTLETRVDRDSRRAVITVRDGLTGGRAVRHAHAGIRPLVGARPTGVSIDALREQTPALLDIESTYKTFAELGLGYGEAFRTIIELRHDLLRETALARISLRAPHEHRQDGYLADPTLVDGAFQAALSLVIADGSGAYLPVDIAEVRLHQALPETVYALIKVTARDANRLTCDIDFFDEDGCEYLSIGGLNCAALFPSAPPARLPDADYGLRWNPVQRPTTDHGGSFIVIGSGGDALATALAGALADQGRLTTALAWEVEGLRGRVMEAMLAGTNPPTLALVFDAGLVTTDPFAEQALGSLLRLIQELEVLGEAAPRCALISRGGMPRAGEPGAVSPAQAALVNFARVVVTELEFPRLAVIDVDCDLPDLAGIVAELKLEQPPAEVALRPEGRRVPELAASGIFSTQRLVGLAPTDDLWQRPVIRLERDRLVLAGTGNHAPADGEIEIGFDALCLLPGEAPVMGFSGRIGRVGPGVAVGLRGRAIFGLAPVTPGTIAVHRLDALSWSERPPGLAPALAAALGPVYWPTASLVHGLAPNGPRHCLVVDTPYGNALAALLEAGGADLIRLPAEPGAWAESVLRDGKGCFDLIAGPLATIDAHFPLSRWLCHDGLLVNTTEGQVEPMLLPPQAAAFRRLHATCAPTQLTADALQSLAGGPTGPVDAMPLSAWPANDGAVRVVRIDPGETIDCHADDALAVRTDATYLVTGGLGGLGRRTAHWLADAGARRLVLLGRRGLATPDAAVLVAELRERGAEALVLACDVAERAEVARAVAIANSPDAPLRGIFHAAGTLADKPIVELTASDLGASLGAKVKGADALQLATAGLELDYFVLFSSVSALVGNKYQANYCAANGYLDALALQRHACGLPALSVNFGAIGDVGMAASPLVEAHLRQIGLPPLAPERALAGVAVALHTGIAVVYVGARADWSRYCRYAPRAARTDRLAALCAPYLDADQGDRLAMVRTELAKLADAERQAALATLLGEIIAGTLGIEASVIAPTRPLADIGLDSLISVEVQFAIETSLGAKVSALALLGDGTVEKLARAMLVGMGLAPADAAGTGAPTVPGAAATAGPVPERAAV
jgi:acyl transferase domain-containing protein/NAD(P)-dependent dehydrogenase (short-subunit alcohol dehydrogenase family)/acyl carrier protein